VSWVLKILICHCFFIDFDAWGVENNNFSLMLVSGEVENIGLGFSLILVSEGVEHIDFSLISVFGGLKILILH